MLLASLDELLEGLLFVLRELSLAEILEVAGACFRISNFYVLMIMKVIGFKLREIL